MKAGRSANKKVMLNLAISLDEKNYRDDNNFFLNHGKLYQVIFYIHLAERTELRESCMQTVYRQWDKGAQHSVMVARYGHVAT